MKNTLAITTIIGLLFFGVMAQAQSNKNSNILLDAMGDFQAGTNRIFFRFGTAPVPMGNKGRLDLPEVGYFILGKDYFHVLVYGEAMTNNLHAFKDEQPMDTNVRTYGPDITTINPQFHRPTTPVYKDFQNPQLVRTRFAYKNKLLDVYLNWEKDGKKFARQYQINLRSRGSILEWRNGKSRPGINYYGTRVFLNGYGDR